MSLLHRLEPIVLEWVHANCPSLETSGQTASLVQPCKDPRHGHFQSNAAMVAAKVLKKNPRELAAQLAEHCAKNPSLLPPQIAGPGFVNFVFKPEAVAAAAAELLGDARLGIPQTSQPKTIVVDFSSPNVAKSMHVGHIRSTILGASISELYAALGHKVIRDNHLGDWGTQFGIILLGYKLKGQPPLDIDNAIDQMEKLYKETNALCDADENLRAQAREELVKLQSGDPDATRLWKLFIDYSRKDFEKMYARLGVKFDHWLGESFYNPWLKEVVDELLWKKIAEKSEGAVVVFFPENEKMKDKPFLIQKSDGASLYATTDLATVRYRVLEWKSDVIVYVTDGRQQLHFQQLFATCQRWGFGEVKFEHAWFGSILGQDRKPFKTRSGETVKLRDLLDEAETRAAAILKEKRADLDETKARELARVIGIGALKYADQLQNRNLDYIFDWDKLLAFDGNTAPYLINAYVRTRSILRKAEEAVTPGPILLVHALDDELSRKLLDFGDVVTLAAEELRPHHICGYLYDLASLYHRFFEHCPVRQAETPELRASRLRLCRLTGDVLARGLSLLGIQTVEEM